MNNTYLLYAILVATVLSLIFIAISAKKAPSIKEEVKEEPIVVKPKRKYKKRVPKANVIVTKPVAKKSLGRAKKTAV